jgi:hypothetical protein
MLASPNMDSLAGSCPFFFLCAQVVKKISTPPSVCRQYRALEAKQSHETAVSFTWLLRGQNHDEFQNKIKKQRRHQYCSQ